MRSVCRRPARTPSSVGARRRRSTLARALATVASAGCSFPLCFNRINVSYNNGCARRTLLEVSSAATWFGRKPVGRSLRHGRWSCNQVMMRRMRELAKTRTHMALLRDAGTVERSCFNCHEKIIQKLSYWENFASC